MDDFDWEWDFTIEDRSYRHRRGLGCGAILVFFPVFLFLFLLTFVWVLHHRRQLEVVIFVGLVATVAWLARGYVTPYFRLASPKDANAPPTTLAEVKEGLVHTTGLAFGVTAPVLHDPIYGTPCVFFRVVVEPVDRPGTILFESRSADEIVLDDGSGNRVVVRLDGAKWLVQRQHDVVSSPVAPEEHVAKYFAARGLAFPDSVRVRVIWIAPHELVFVRGVARAASAQGEAGYRTSEATAPLVIAADAHPVVIALEAIPAKRERKIG